MRMLNGINLAKKDHGDGSQDVLSSDLWPALLEENISKIGTFIYNKVESDWRRSVGMGAFVCTPCWSHVIRLVCKHCAYVQLLTVLHSYT